MFLHLPLSASDSDTVFFLSDNIGGRQFMWTVRTERISFRTQSGNYAKNFSYVEAGHDFRWFRYLQAGGVFHSHVVLSENAKEEEIRC